MYKLLVLITALMASACSAPTSPEAQVRESLAAMEAAAERRDLGDFMENVSPQYLDRDGRDAAQIASYVRGFFVMNQSIRLLTRINKLEFPTRDEARATISMGVMGNDAAASDSLHLALDAKDFDVTLVRQDGRWLVSYAEWRRQD